MRREVWRKFRSPTPQGWLRKVSSHGRINICYHSEILTNLFAFEKYWTKPSLRKQLTFGDATTGFPAKWRLRNERRNSILMTCHYPDLGSASDWLNQISHAARPIRSTTQIWVVTRHQYGISALVSQTSFGGETNGSVAKNVGCFLSLNKTGFQKRWD